MAIRLACGHEVADAAQIHYCDYVRLHKLLHPDDHIHNPNEHLFITTHQSSELWFQQVLVDMQQCIDALDSDNIGLATWTARRLSDVAKLLIVTVQILDRLAASDFFAFRASLAPASGQESQQFRAIEILAGRREPAYRDYLHRTPGSATVLWTEWLDTLWESRSLRDALRDALARRGVGLPDIYVAAPAPNPHADLWLFAESLMDFDEAISFWRVAHARVAERAIGPMTAGTGRSTGVFHLDTAAGHHLFPELWEVRSVLWKQQRAAS